MIGNMRTHQEIDARSLAMHRAIAARLVADPELLRIAQGNLERRLAEGGWPRAAGRGRIGRRGGRFSRGPWMRSWG